MLKRAQKFKWHYCVAIPDDHTPCKNFLYRIREDFRAIQKKDRSAVAMNIIVNATASWYKNRFVDGAFICTQNFFYALSWKVERVGPDWLNSTFWNKNRPPSSGVGKQMSERLSVHAQYRIARVRNVSYLEPMKCNSRMYPPEKYPKRPKWWGNDNFIDKPKEEESNEL